MVNALFGKGSGVASGGGLMGGLRLGAARRFGGGSSLKAALTAAKADLPREIKARRVEKRSNALEMAKEAVQRREWLEAREALSAGLEAAPGDINLLSQRSLMHLKLGDYPKGACPPAILPPRRTH